MTSSNRFYLALTLCLLLIGLVSHSIPSLSICSCSESQNKNTEPLKLDVCLVCQLQAGVISVHIIHHFSGQMLFKAGYELNSIRLDITEQIHHPPILLLI